MQGMNNPLIKNRYKVIREIGKGGTGIVYLVQDTLKDNLHFALKTIKHGILKRFGIKSMDTFKNEYEIMTRLKHPNLTQVYEFGTENNNCYIVQEYLKGSLLSETRADQDRIIDIIIQILRVLEYIHSRNLVYRDIKPANIMMIEDKVKLMDFGLCRCISQTDAKVSGSFAYMSPESLNAVLTVSMDIFSLGICFFELLTKSRFYIDEKFTVNNILLLLKNHDEFRRYQERRLKTVRGESIRKIIAKMIHFDIRQRYKNCAEIIFDINKKLNCSYEYETKETSQSYVLGNEFANRKTELKVLKNNISDGDKFLAYSGSSGIGKTRMFFEFKKHCILNDILFFEAKCMESETKNYHAIKSILFQIIVLASDKLLPVYGRHLKLIFERHIRLMDYKPTEIVNDPKLLQEIIVQNMSDFIIDFSKEESRSIIVYFDDYQWIDHGSELIINNLLNRMETENISNLSFYANINESKIPSERNIMSIFSKKGAKKYDLAPLDDAGFSEYINNIFGPEYIDKSIEKAIPYLRRSVGGNPFFMQELIRSFIEKGIIIKDKCFWKMLKTFKTSDVPKNIMDIIKTRIETLFRDDDKRKILKVLSLFRIDIDINTIKSIINKIALVDSVKVLLELEYLEVLKFIEIDNIVYVSFANNLIKNHIRDSIDNKGEISIFLADTLEELGLSSSNDLIEELAFLYSEGKNMKKSAYYFEKCGDMAKNNYFNYKALSFYDTALKIYDGIGEGLFRELNIANKKAMVLEIIGLWDESAELLEKSIKKAEKANENIIAELKCSHGLILIQQGQYDRAMDSLIHARDIGCKNNKSIYLTALKYIGNIYFDKGDYDKAMEYYNEGREFCKKSGDKQGYSNFIGGIGNIYWQIGDYDRAMDCFHEQKKICRELGDKRNYAQALGKIGGVYYNKGNNNMAMKYYNKDLKICKELGDKRSCAYTYGNMGVIYKEKGNYTKAMEYFNKKKTICEQLGHKRGYAAVFCNLGNLYLDKGDYDKAMKFYNQYRDICMELGNKRGYSIAVGNMGLVYADKGEYKKAMDCYNEDMRLCKELGDKRGYLCALGNAGEIYFFTGDYENAMKNYKEQEKMCKELGYHREYMHALGNIGEIYFYQGDYEKAMQYYNEKEKLCDEFGEKIGISDVLIKKGLLYQSKGDHEKAIELYGLSLAYCTEIDHKPGIVRNTVYLAIAYQNMGNLNEALMYYEKAKDIIGNLIKYDLPYFLYNKARLYYDLSDIKMAGELSEEALSLAVGINRKDMIFHSRLLIHKINENISGLKSMLNAKGLDNEQTAVINYELWKLTREIKHQFQAKSIYEKLLKNTPKYDYIKKLEELNA